MDTRTAIAQRYSCRSYCDKPIEDWKLEELIAAGAAAPVAMGRYHQMRMTVIRDGAFLAAWDLAAGAGERHPLYAAPVQILISGCVGGDIPPANPGINAGCMAENISLAATDLGLGSVLLAGPVRALGKHPELLAKLDLPEGFVPLISVAVGYAAAKGKHAETQIFEL